MPHHPVARLAVVLAEVDANGWADTAEVARILNLNHWRMVRPPGESWQEGPAEPSWRRAADTHTDERTEMSMLLVVLCGRHTAVAEWAADRWVEASEEGEARGGHSGTWAAGGSSGYVCCRQVRT